MGSRAVFIIGTILLIIGGIFLSAAHMHYIKRTNKWFNPFAIMDFNKKEIQITLIGMLLVVIGITMMGVS